jgi:PST family polysaccharide transporter
MNDPRNLSRIAATGAAWSLGALVFSRLVTLASTVVLARLLSPDDFGLMALGLLVIGYSDALNDFGLDEAVVVYGGRGTRVADVAYTMSIAIGLGFTIAGFLSAPLLAEVLGEPRLTGVLRALATALLIVSFGQIQKGELARRLMFRRRVAGEIALVVIKAAVSIGLVVAGLGVWGLVWGQLAGTTARVVANWVLCPWKPHPKFDRDIARSLAGFGIRISLASMMGTVALNLDYLAIGSRLGTVALGLYYVAYRLPELLLVQTTQAVTSVLVPTYVTMSGDRDRLVRAFHDSTRVVASVAIPLAIGLAFLAPEIMRVIYGPAWVDAIPVLRLVAVSSALVAMTYPAGATLKAIDRPGVLAALAAIRLAIAVPVLWYAAGRDIESVALAQLAITLPLSIAALVIAGHLVGSRDMPFRAVAPTLPAGAAMVLISVAIRFVGDASGVVGSTLAVTAGLILYMAVLWLLTGEWWRQIFAAVGGRSSIGAGLEGSER